MAMELKTQRVLLVGFIASISLCGVIGIFCMLLGEMSDLVARVLATTATVGGASIFALASAIPWERKRWPPIGPLGMIAVAIAFVLLLVLIWLDPHRWQHAKLFFKALVSACVFAVALPHIGLLSLARLHRQYELVRYGTVGAIALLAATIVVMVVGEIEPGDVVIRYIGAIAILDACGTIAIPILHRVSRIQSHEQTLTTALEISLTCPRCAAQQTVPVGRSACGKCGLRFSIEIDEEHCPKCGYALYQLTSGVCPECGAPVTGGP